MRKLFGRLTRWTGSERKVSVGVCAMDKKAKSKQMQEILDRLTAFGEFTIVHFSDDILLNKPIEEWPICDTLLSWHSDGFPLAKAEAYAALRRPFCINDLSQQHNLQRRFAVYKTLVAHNIPVPTHIIVQRSGPGEEVPGFVETEDYVELNGTRITKPFVEKPENAEDHNVHIYYPSSLGGGVKKLFRKVRPAASKGRGQGLAQEQTINNKSSEFDVNHSGRVRRDGSYLYEEFLPTGGTDVKVYTVGARYAHAEARKSPVVDGKVLRTADGKEMRFPVLLTPQEKEIARQVVVAFKQNVCGFDLLRSEKGKSAVSCVCDVNGWSFVKNSRRFYDDAAGILRTILLGAVQPNRLAASPSPTLSFKALGNQHGLAQDDADLLSCFAADDPDMPSVDAGEVARTDTRSTDEELRCVLAVITPWRMGGTGGAGGQEGRGGSDGSDGGSEGNRTPKQKLKIKVRAEALLALFAKHKDAKGKQAKLKTPGQLQELLDITRALLAVLFKGNASSQLEVLGLGKAGLAAPRGSVSSQGPEEGAGGPPLGSGEVGEAGWANTTPAPAPAPVLTDEQREQLLELREKLRIVQTVLEQASFDGINRKVQIKPLRWGLAPAPCARTPSGPLAAVSPTASTAGAQPTLTTGSFGGSAAPTPTPTPTPAPTPGLAPPPPGLPVALASQAPSAFITMALPPGLEPINPLAPVPAAGMGQGGCLGLGPQDSYAPGAAGAAGQGAGSTAQGSVRHSSSNQGGGAGAGGGAHGRQVGREGRVVSVRWLFPALAAAGILTHAGRQQAEDLGKVFRMVMYPRYGSAGGGLLRLHSTYRHDLKIYSSDEGRVQASAAAFAQGLLDLEGTSLTPILVSLVKKDAAMLDAFGKGASDDIRQAKSLVYEAMTHDPDKGPPPPCTLTSTGPAPDNSSEPGPTPLPGPSLSAGVGVPGGVEGGVAGKPESPLALLRRLVELLKVLVAQLRELCVQEGLNSRQASGAAAGSGPPSAPSGPSLPPLWGAGGGPQRYSSVSHGPAEWRLEPGRPCSGERMLLMYDRWQKLLKSVWNEKKGKFDISKVPDIYDSAKYDAIHNSHLGVDLQELYQVARQLARAVIPSEYGTDPLSRLRINLPTLLAACGLLLILRSLNRLNLVCQSRAIFVEDLMQEVALTANKITAMYSGPFPFSALDFPELTAFTNVAGPGSCLVYNGSGHLALQPHGSGSMTVQSNEADSDSDSEEVGSRQAAADMETTFGENEEEEEGSELGSEPVQLYAIPPKGRRAALVPASDSSSMSTYAKGLAIVYAHYWDKQPSDEDFLERLAIVKARYCMDTTLANGQLAPALLEQQKLSAIPTISMTLCAMKLERGQMKKKTLLRIGSKIASESAAPCSSPAAPSPPLRPGWPVQLLGKLLVDLAAMREESQVTQDQDDACSLADSCMLAPALAGLVLPHPPLTATYASASRPASPSKLLTGAAVGGAAGPEAGGEGASPAGPWGGAGQSARSSVGGAAAAAAGSVGGLGAGGGSRAGPSGGVLQAAALVAQQAMGLGGRLEAERSLPLSSSASVTSQLGSGMLAGGGGEAGVEAQETIHRLLPEYAPHINSPLRHVRTRIYFTSESHIHSLINVLRYCHLHGVATSSGQTAAGSDSSSSGPAPHPGAPLLPPSACTALDGCQELDYLTHLVLRLYENKTVPFGAPERFRVEMLFSPGANYDPFEVAAQAQAAQAAQAAAATAATSQPSPPAAAHPHTPSGGAGAAAGEQAGAAAAAGATDCQLLGALAAAGTVVSDATATPASTAAAAPAGLPGLDPGPPAGGAASEAAGVVSGSRPSPSQPGPAHPLPTDKPGGAVERGGPGGVKAGAKEGRGSGGVAPGGCRGPDWHVLPVVPRVLLHEGEHGMPLAYLEDALLPMAKVSKFATPGYATTLLARNNPTLGVPRSLSRIGASGGVRDSAGSAGLISHRSHVGGSDTPLSVDSCC
ncbi:hypothetical protein QJQ45_017659 [Haematococcus lacustris]|nr:hypothetical protein QJQ45_017659 [Haematococcus lacustris]